MSDHYRLVTVTFRALREKSFFVDHPSSIGQAAIQRSLIHGGDDRKLDTLFDGETIAIRIRDWKARELGFKAAEG